MLAAPLSEQDDFLQLVTQLYGDIALKDGLKRLRAKAWSRFLELGLPTRNLEVYRYIRLRNLFSRSFKTAEADSLTPEQVAPFVYPECQDSFLVFVNGMFEPKLSNLSALPKNIVITPLGEAVHSFGTFLDNHWAKSIKEETDPFAILNAAIHPAGAFIYLPPQATIAVPLQVLHILTAKAQQALALPKVLFFVGRQAEVTVAESTVELGCSGYCFNQTSEFVIEEGAHVKVVAESSGLSPDAWHLSAIRGTLKRDATLKVISFTDGAMTVRSDLHVSLMGENADACLNGVWMLDDKREAHTHVMIDHQAPNCRSNQLFKGVLTDISRSSFEGKIFVRQAAQKTEAYQLNNNLILSDRANADSKPNLEIFADDVKASHGATVGQLDEDQLFYCRARGYGLDEARNLLVHGFCEEVIDLVPLPSVLQRLSARARRFLV